MDRESLLFLTKLAEETERYDEMVERVTALVTSADADLSLEERNLLSVAFKNATGMRRASWRIVSAVQKQQRARGDEAFPDVSTALRTTIEDELTGLCKSLLGLIDQKLLPLAEKSAESKVYYLKMKGDYGRYMAEVVTDADARQKLIAATLRDYQAADDLAQVELAPTHFLRLGLALNFSVFHYDILSDTLTACKMARRAFDGAIADLNALTDATYRDSALVMQLLRDNITLWTSEDDEDTDAAF